MVDHPVGTEHRRNIALKSCADSHPRLHGCLRIPSLPRWLVWPFAAVECHGEGLSESDLGRKCDGLSCVCMPFDHAASFLSTLTGRTRSAFNARPAPVPRPLPGSPVLDMNPSLGSAAFRLVQRATKHERKSSWHAATPRPLRRPIRRTSSPGMSPTRARRVSGPAWFHRDRKGFSLQLEVVPINGRIVLRAPLEDEKKEPGA